MQVWLAAFKTHHSGHHKYWTSRWQTWGCVMSKPLFWNQMPPCNQLKLVRCNSMQNHSKTVQKYTNDHLGCLHVLKNSVFLLKTSYLHVFSSSLSEEYWFYSLLNKLYPKYASIQSFSLHCPMGIFWFQLRLIEGMSLCTVQCTLY